MWSPDPHELARWQLERDHAATARFAGLLERKQARMSVSPLAYLRGSAPLFYRLLVEHPELRGGPDDAGWICGDAHLENFGVFRTDVKREGKSQPEEGGSQDARVVFDVNDFDEAVVAPLRYDVLRLCTSLILGARQLGETGQHTLALAASLVDSYVKAAAAAVVADPALEPAPVTALVAKATKRSHRDLVEGRTSIVNGQRRFVRGLRYADLPPDLEKNARAAFAHYESTLPDHKSDRFEIVDVAFRIAGTGSLGALRIAVLTRGKGVDDSGWLFDMKEQGEPSAAPLIQPPAMNPAERVATAIRRCLEHPPRMVGTTAIGDTPLFVRRLAPQEDKLDFASVGRADLEPVARYFGALLGRAHRRGADTPPRQWTGEERSALVDHAVVLAGIHESTYLALCKTI